LGKIGSGILLDHYLHVSCRGCGPQIFFDNGARVDPRSAFRRRVRGNRHGAAVPVNPVNQQPCTKQVRIGFPGNVMGRVRSGSFTGA